MILAWIGTGNDYKLVINNSSGVNVGNPGVPAGFKASNSGLYCVKGNDTKLYKLIVDYTNGTVSYEELLDFEVTTSNVLFAPDDSYIKIGNNIYALNYENHTFTQINTSSQVVSNSIIAVFTTMNNFLTSGYTLVSVVYDNKIIIGVRYKGEIYYKQSYSSKTLTAKQSDVKSGETFIGVDGMFERGTLEVSE